MMIDEMVYLNELAKRPVLVPNEKLMDLKASLEAASHYIEENEVIHVKTKRNIPTVIEYKGRRYILDHADHRKR
jgi:hypothetical protein